MNIYMKYFFIYFERWRKKIKITMDKKDEENKKTLKLRKTIFLQTLSENDDQYIKS